MKPPNVQIQVRHLQQLVLRDKNKLRIVGTRTPKQFYRRTPKPKQPYRQHHQKHYQVVRQHVWLILRRRRRPLQPLKLEPLHQPQKRTLLKRLTQKMLHQVLHKTPHLVRRTKRVKPENKIAPKRQQLPLLQRVFCEHLRRLIHLPLHQLQHPPQPHQIQPPLQRLPPKQTRLFRQNQLLHPKLLLRQHKPQIGKRKPLLKTGTHPTRPLQHLVPKPKLNEQKVFRVFVFRQLPRDPPKPLDHPQLAPQQNHLPNPFHIRLQRLHRIFRQQLPLHCGWLVRVNKRRRKPKPV